MRILIEILKTLLRILLLAGMVFGSLYYLTCTEDGLQLVWSFTEKYIPQEIHIGSVEGTLLSRLNVRDISYREGATTLTVKQLKIDWKGWKFVRHYLINHGEFSFKAGNIPALVNSMHIREIIIKEAHVNIANAVIDIDGRLDKKWHLQWSANIPDLNKVITGARGKVVTTGFIIGDVYQPDIQAKVNLDNLVLGDVVIKSLSGTLTNHNTIDKRTGRYAMLSSAIDVNGLVIATFRVPDFAVNTVGGLRGHHFQQQAHIVFSPVNTINADFIVPDFNMASGLKQKFTATAKVDVKNFGQFKTLFVDVPQIRALNGKITGAFKASGKLNKPVIDGGLQANQGSVYIPDVRVHLSNIYLSTYYHSGRKVILSGHFTPGQGEVTLAGTYGIEESALPLALTLRGTNVVAADTKEYQVKISPDVTLLYRNSDLTLGGKIVVPYAHIQPIDLSSTSTLPTDVVIVNEQPAEVSTPTNLTMRMQVVLGESVKVKYRGLKANLQGSIMIFTSQGNPLTATGEVGIAKNGTYRAYGRELTIQQGRLIYAGNLLSNPGISLRAIHTIKRVGFAGSNSQYNRSADLPPVYAGSDSLVVGVAVNGVINKPRVTLFSEPAGLGQADILSYLLLGYPQSQASGASSLALLNVASEMYGGTSKTNVVSKLQKSLGLDELSVGATEYYDASPSADHTKSTSTATTVNIGRSLGHNLSLHYSLGVFQQIQVFSLRYQINRHLAVQTETSTLENGGDLIYQLESSD